MTLTEPGYETPKWRTLWLLAAFALLVGVGVVTVLVPELEDEPSSKTDAEPMRSDTDGTVE